MEYVLGKWTPAEARRLELGLHACVQALDRWLCLEFPRAMSDTNARPKDHSLRSSAALPLHAHAHTVELSNVADGESDTDAGH
jgi:hypothetical protein